MKPERVNPQPPPRRYSKTDLRRGTVKPAPTSTRPKQVNADEQAALFGEDSSPLNATNDLGSADKPEVQQQQQQQ